MSFFGISIGHAKLKSFDLSEFDIMVFHEIYEESNIYRRIKQFVKQKKQNKRAHRIMKLMLMMSVIISDLNHRRTQQTVLHRT